MNPDTDILEVVFKNGELIKDYSLEDIRKRSSI